ncbi:ABC transporter ATP-binding protein [Demequina aurantiaca]|uniref:ABC transporter ATP-binding protein n=1 Tax=Demequina aurantiaca TaxID=676200 RepID=UPI003D34123A
MTSAISLRQISKQFVGSQPHALTGVNLDVLTGTSTALLGPSGSGKSTILRIIAGLEDPSGGRVLLNGRDLTDVLPEKRNVGLVFQRPLLFPHLSVIDNVAFADRAAGVSRQRARERAMPYLEMVQLADLGGRGVGSLSGGQEQRVAIARALAAQPAILLLDEPFSALDAALRQEMHELLVRIQRELSPTVLLVTHDRDEATAVADRIAVLEDGQLLQHDTVHRVYHRPASVDVARLMGGENFISGVVSDGIHYSQMGPVAVEDSTPEGAGVLVFRHESAGLALGHAPATSDEELPGTVLATSRTGLRWRATIRIGEAQLLVEVPGTLNVQVGDAVTVTLPRAILSVVPA